MSRLTSLFLNLVEKNQGSVNSKKVTHTSFTYVFSFLQPFF